jgi:glycogen debranching enzyme
LHILSLPSDFSKPIQIDLPITKPGVFHYFIEYDASATVDTDDQLSLNGASGVTAKGKRIQSQTGAFNVDPILTIPKRSSILSDNFQPLDVKQGGGKIGSENVALPTDGLVIQSVIAKWMGTIDQWDKHLNVTRDRGYNMLHFTPLQQRGESGSPYSIFDQMAFDDELFKNGKKMSVEAKQKGVKELLARIRKQWGILSLTDVVWNHTANNSEWLQDHPESGKPFFLLSFDQYCELVLTPRLVF